MVTMCLECKHREIIKDNHGQYHSICTCCESDNFLEELCSVFDRCDNGELEFDEDDESEGEG
jgi:hypothetical protein